MGFGFDIIGHNINEGVRNNKTDSWLRVNFICFVFNVGVLYQITTKSIAYYFAVNLGLKKMKSW